jgi:CRISPR-associated endonuclease Csn1
MHSSDTIWAFDLGKASLGEAVRDNNSFLHIESWLIPEDLARRGPATIAGTPASRYRAMKTREAHRAREERLRAICAEAGIELLAAKRVARDPATKKFHIVQEADERLQREFPRKGDETCYTSCLLRIKLLQGEKLEGWQVFKALHSAIQRRGYDAGLAWKNRRTKDATDDEEGQTAKAAGDFRAALSTMAGERTEFHLPCYDRRAPSCWPPMPHAPKPISETLRPVRPSTR